MMKILKELGKETRGLVLFPIAVPTENEHL